MDREETGCRSGSLPEVQEPVLESAAACAEVEALTTMAA